MPSVFSSTRLIALLAVVLLAPNTFAAGPADTPVVDPPSEFPDAEPLVPVDDNAEMVETANYSDGKISIDYPATWEVEVDESGSLAIENVPTAAVDLVETELFQVAAPPGPLVDANIDSFIEEGSAVSRYSSVTIDDQSALVVWLADRPEALTSAIATFIGYGDNTILLFSRYNPENATAEDSILRLHSSFSNLAASELAEPQGEGDQEDATQEDDTQEDGTQEEVTEDMAEEESAADDVTSEDPTAETVTPEAAEDASESASDSEPVDFPMDLEEAR